MAPFFHVSRVRVLAQLTAAPAKISVFTATLQVILDDQERTSGLEKFVDSDCSVSGNTEVQIDRQIAVIASSRPTTAVWSRIRSKGYQ